MLKNYILKLLATVAVLPAAILANGEPGESVPGTKRPNILFLFVDDLGWGDVGVFHQNARRDSGDRTLPYHSTPHLDAMAEQGAILTHHYVAAPVCAPSRSSLFQGVTQGHANVRDNQFDKALDENHTLGTVLQEAGYSTALIGKWGLQGDDALAPNWPSHPLKRGFDYFYGYLRHIDGHEHYPVEQLYFGDKVHRKSPVAVLENRENVTAGLEKCFTTDLWTARAKKWIVEQHSSNSEKPFFLFLSYDTPHAVLELPTSPYPEGGGVDGGMQWIGEPGRAITTARGVPDSWFQPEYAAGTYDHDGDSTTPERPWPDVYRRYATLVRRIDDSVGDLLKLLKDLDIDRETLVVFASDNGPSVESYLDSEFSPEFFGGYGPFDGIKRDVWEGGIRTPGIVRWPEALAGGQVLDTPSATWDWLPTFADAAGLAAPARADGVSLLPALTRKGELAEREALYFEYLNKNHMPAFDDFEADRRGRKRGQMQAIRYGRYMGVRYDIQSHSDPFEIYDLETDPKQADNLALSSSPKFAELQQNFKDLALQSRRPEPEAPRPYDGEPMPPISEVGTLKAGLVWQGYAEPFPWVPNPLGLAPSIEGIAKEILPKQGVGALMHRGFLEVSEAGTYRFSAQADGGIVFRLHEAAVVNLDFGYDGEHSQISEVNLSEGLHPITIYSRHHSDKEPILKLLWSGPGFEMKPIPAAALKHSFR